jgi:hypothetical protein
MVRAILDGTKNQTRRVSGLDVINANPDRYEFIAIASGPGVPHFAFKDRQTGAQVLVKCKQGQPGDRLWVREAWAPVRDGAGAAWYRADMCEATLNSQPPGFRWKPSIHMPRATSRITLDVTGVRVERLQDISEADAMAEGIRRQAVGRWFSVAGLNGAGTTAHAAYALLWQLINGPQSWNENPWVWAIQFEKLGAK